MEFEKQSGIYKIINLVNNKVYVGKSLNLKNRKYSHFNSLKKNKHPNEHLQNAFNKYGKENFVFEILELVFDISILSKREQYWIEELKSYVRNIGYNIRRESDENCISVETIEKLKNVQDKNSKPVICIELNEKFRSVRDAERITGIDESQIRRCCKGKNNTAGGYHWMFENVGYVPYVNKPDNKISIVCWETKKEFSSIKEASLFYNIDYSSICDVISGKKHCCTAGGYHWYKKGENISLKDIYFKNKNSKPLIRINDNKIYSSISKLCKQEKIHRKRFENIKSGDIIEVNNLKYCLLIDYIDNNIIL